MKYILNLKNISKKDTALAGGKGASLVKMIRAGFPVPPGFVVLARVSLPEAKNEILAEFKKLKTKYVAVRSSANVEDSLSASWAGQLETYLNVTEKNLLKSIEKCRASINSPRAIAYRRQKKLGNKKISVAVVIQKMVKSKKSGIAFSVHPVTQDKNQLIIEAAHGLGEAIVSGQITPDSYVVEKSPRRIIDKNIKEKQVLSDKEILKLSEIIICIENHYGFPVDVEWAVEKGRFYIVQSRPITTLRNR